MEIEIIGGIGTVLGILGVYLAGKYNVAWLLAGVASFFTMAYGAVKDAPWVVVASFIYFVLEVRLYLIGRKNAQKSRRAELSRTDVAD